MNLQSLSYLCYPETPISLHSPQGETDVRSPRGYDVAGVGGFEFALWLIQRQRAAPSTGGQVHTHMTKMEDQSSLPILHKESAVRCWTMHMVMCILVLQMVLHVQCIH
jgi:hypothetical protein